MYYQTRFIHRLQENFLVVGLHDYEEIQQLKTINDEYVELAFDALCCLRYFPNVKHLILTPGTIHEEDLGLLNGLKIKSLKLDYYTYETDNYTIDLEKFPVLELVFAKTQYCIGNVAKCTTLKTLIVQEWLTQNLEYLSDSHIQALKIMSGKLRSIDGVGKIRNLISLALSNQRSLLDCSQLKEKILESLMIENCGKLDIKSFPLLPNLRMLCLSGSKKIPDVQTILFLAPNLEWLMLYHPIEDGDLSQLMNLKHVVIIPNCRHYSHKDSELPKTENNFCSGILAYDLSILPEV